MEDLNLKVFNLMKGINKSKTLVNHISCECGCELMVESVIQNKNRLMVSPDVSVKSYKTSHMRGILCLES